MDTLLTDVTTGALHAENPFELDIPNTISGSPLGTLSGPAEEASRHGAIGGDSILPGKCRHFSKFVDEYLPSRYAVNWGDLRRAGAIRTVVSQSTIPGGGMLFDQKNSDPCGGNVRSISR